MCRVDVIDDFARIEGTGLKLRKGTSGPELSMLRSFATQLESNYYSKGGTSRIIILFEPMIDSGYPDLVALRYTKTFMKNWKDCRNRLTNDDLRVLSYLISTPSSISGIETALGFSATKIESSLRILSECNLVLKTKKKWRSRKQDEVLGIKSITSYEAKMQSASTVFKQALINTRFCSSSYAIISSKKPTNNTKNLFEQSGLGLLADRGNIEIVEPKKRQLPIGLLTLKFNEWIGRAITQGVIA